MADHYLKIFPEYYQAVVSGEMKACVRIDDRKFKKGDFLILKEWDPQDLQYTGSECHAVVTNVFRGDLRFECDLNGFVVLSLEVKWTGVGS